MRFEPGLAVTASPTGGSKEIILRILNHIYLIFVQLLKWTRLLPQTLAGLTNRRRQQGVWDELEVERLDRIRNPDKYRGKEI